MSNPPFGSPLYGEEEDFSFPIEAPNDPNTSTPNPVINQEISLNSLPSSSIPVSDYQDVSMFLDYYDHDQGFDPLIGQIFSTIQEIPDEYWVREIEHADDDLDDIVLQSAQQGCSSDGQGNDQHRPIDQQQHHHDQGDHQGGVGEGSSSMKKLDHNAKERVRRLKLNASYLALRSSLPDTKKPKEKWSAAYIIDRALDYIPGLQAEVDKLTLEKTSMLSVIGNHQQQQALTTVQDKQQEVPNDKHPLTVSITEVKRGELIVQICHQREVVLGDKFSSLIERLEGEDIQVLGASSVYVSQHTFCFHLHIQMGEKPVQADEYVADLHKKLLSWLS